MSFRSNPLYGGNPTLGVAMLSENELALYNQNFVVWGISLYSVW